MKKLFVFVIASMFFSVGFAQPLTGIKTIKLSGGDYSSFNSAINALNSNGVGAGGVAFNVDAGFVDSAANLVITDTTANLTNHIIFQKIGNGNNPLIIAKAGTGNLDGIIKITGTDYITFDKIDLVESTTNSTANTRMEWGYAFLKSASKNGSLFAVIKNCTITLNKLNTNATYGIYSANHLTTSTTDLVLNDINSSNSHNRFYSNSISNVYVGIYIKGTTSSITTPIYDIWNEVGVDGANYITNYSGTGTTTSDGIFAVAQNNAKIANNIINGGTGSTSNVYGIHATTGTNCSIDIYNNTITVSSSATGANASMYGISNSIGSTGTSNIVNIYNNQILNCKYSGTSGLIFTGITNTSSAYTVNIYDNYVNHDTIGGTGTFTGINAGACTNLNFYSNQVFGNRKSGTNGTMNCLTLNSGIVNCFNNLVHDNSIAAGTGTLYGYYNASNVGVTENVYATKVYNLVHSGTGNIYGIFSNVGATSIIQIYSDTVYSLTAANATYGIYSSSGADIKIHNNLVNNLASTGTNGIAYGINVNSGTAAYIYNNFVSDLKTPASTGSTAVNGVYINGGTNMYVYHNSVFLNASSSSTKTFGTTAFYSSTIPTLELRNNIFVNTSISGPAGGKTRAS